MSVVISVLAFIVSIDWVPYRRSVDLRGIWRREHSRACEESSQLGRFPRTRNKHRVIGRIDIPLIREILAADSNFTNMVTLRNGMSPENDYKSYIGVTCSYLSGPAFLRYVFGVRASRLRMAPIGPTSIGCFWPQPWRVPPKPWVMRSITMARSTTPTSRRGTCHVQLADPDRHPASEAGDRRIAQIGRTHSCTRPTCTTDKTTLAKPGRPHIAMASCSA